MGSGRRLLPTALLLALVGAGRDARAECLPFSPQPSSSRIIPGARQFVYATPPDHAPLLLDAFAQPDGELHPAVLVVHGGGWTAGSRVAHIGQFLELLTEAGYQWMAVDYRLGGAARRQEARDDVRAALAFVGCHARALGIDPRASSCLARTSARNWRFTPPPAAACAAWPLSGACTTPPTPCRECRRWWYTAAPIPNRRLLTHVSSAIASWPPRALAHSTWWRAAFIAPRTGGRRSGCTSRV